MIQKAKLEASVVEMRSRQQLTQKGGFKNIHTWTNMLLSRFSSDPEGKIRALAKKNKNFYD